MRRLLVVLALLLVGRVDAATVVPGLLGSLKGANLNSTSDQAITMPDGTAGYRYYITRILVTNASTTPTSAVGGVYTATSKGGSAVVANSQAYSSLTATTKALSLTLAITDTVFSASTLYLSLTTGAGTACTADVYVFGEILPSLAGEISITAPVRFQVVQRSGSTGSVTISGTLNTFDNMGSWLVEARLAGGSWQTVSSTATSGAFSGTVTFNQGQGALDLRATQGSVVSNLRSIADVGVGDIIPLPGQSNSSGRGLNNQSFTHATLKAANFKKSNTWALLTDPVSTDQGIVDTIADDFYAAGSPWPLVATKLMADRGVPVAFVPCALGATAIASWLPAADHFDRGTLYGACAYRTQLAGGCAAAIFYQGEWDAGPLGDTPTTRATYKARLKTMADAWVADTGCKILPVKLHDSTGLADVNEAAIRGAVADAISEDSNLLAAADLSGLTSDDAFHLQSNANLQAAATIFATAIETALP